MPSLNRNQFQGPRTQQLPLPGMGSPEQMRLFDTHRAGPASIYGLNPATDASDWTDQDKQVAREPADLERLDEGDDEEPVMRGEFFDFPLSQEDQDFVTFAPAHTREMGRQRDAGTYLGHDEYPTKASPEVQFGDLLTDGDGWGEASWHTREGSLVGKVGFHEDRWGPQVEHAEINPLYRGRGFSARAIPEFAANLEEGQGIVHAGGFTPAGARAFQAKGIPTETQIDQAFNDFLFTSEESGDLDLDDMDSLEETFRGNLEVMQDQVLKNLPTSRKGAFAKGWRPEYKFGRQEELPEMPPKYSGA